MWQMVQIFVAYSEYLNFTNQNEMFMVENFGVEKSGVEMFVTWVEPYYYLEVTKLKQNHLTYAGTFDQIENPIHL